MKSLQKKRAAQYIVLIILICMVLLVIFPYIWMLLLSLKSNRELLMTPEHFFPQDPTLSGYQTVIFESPFFYWFRNSAFISVTNTVIIIFTSTLLGYVFAQYEFRGKNVLFMLLISTMMIPAQTTMIPSFLLINSLGFYDSLFALILPAIISPFGVFLSKQYCEEIPKDLLDSARIDGANSFKIYTAIVVPQIRPAIGSLTIFTFLAHWNDYLNPLIYLTSSRKMTLPLAISYFSSNRGTDLSATMAAASLITIPMIIVFILFQKQFVKGISMTGIK